MLDRVGGGAPAAAQLRRALVLVLAALLFAGVFLARLAVDDPSQTVTLLYALPIALLAIELGVGWGLAAAALALGLFAIWDLTWSSTQDRSAVDYLTRGAAFFVLGGFVGAIADRLRRVSARERPVLGALERHAVHRRIRRLLQASQSGLEADARAGRRRSFARGRSSTSSTPTTARRPSPKQPA